MRDLLRARASRRVVHGWRQIAVPGRELWYASPCPRRRPASRASLKRGLEGARYAVDLVATGIDALSAALAIPYDLVILDVLLPDMSGFRVCAELRAQGRTMPILMLTALGDIDHRVDGLDLGADDYLTKPFAFRELEARIRALLRRETAVAKSAELRFLDIAVDTRTL